MSNNVTRTFTVEELEDLAVTAGGEAVVLDEEHEQRRWYTWRRVVFRLNDQHWKVFYREPATEMQDGIDEFDNDPVTATLVEPYDVTVTKYRAVKENSA